MAEVRHVAILQVPVTTGSQIHFSLLNYAPEAHVAILQIQEHV